MGLHLQSGAALAVAALAGATIMATPIAPPRPVASNLDTDAAVNLTASSRPLYPWPWVFAPEATASHRDGSQAAAPTIADDDTLSTADRIDEDFIDFRTDVRTVFTPFANQLGYVGKQLYVGFNFVESISASAVFNSTDVLRGEGFFTNLGDFARDVVLAAVWVVADELYLHVPGLPPIVVLPDRPPSEYVPGWRRPLPPQPGRDLVVPVPYVPPTDGSAEASADAVTADDDAAAGTDDSAAPEDDATDESADSAAVEGDSVAAGFTNAEKQNEDTAGAAPAGTEDAGQTSAGEPTDESAEETAEGTAEETTENNDADDSDDEQTTETTARNTETDNRGSAATTEE